MKFKLFIALILFTIFSSANTYYVATNGNDNFLGTASQPWKTIQKAANTLIAGDIVYIKVGVYNERILIHISGNETNYITFANYQNDEVIIDGNGITWGTTENRWNGLLDISNQHHLKVIGLKIINSFNAGIFSENAHHITIENNITNNSFSSGIGVWNCNDITLKENEIVLACNGGGQESISVSNSFNCEIFGNNVHHNGNGEQGGEGIDIKQGSHDVNVYQNWIHHLNNRVGIYVDAWNAPTNNINIFQNKVHNCTESGFAIASEFGGLLQFVNIYNNLSYNNKFDGIQIGGWTHEDYTGPTPIKHIKIINNTCYNNGAIDNGFGFGITIDNAFAEDVIVRNNICSQNSSQIEIVNFLTQPQIDHNLLFGNNNTPFATFGTDFSIENPMFINASNFNFRLQTSSPAIDFGITTNAPINDFENTERPIGLGIDLGAFEYNPTASVENNTKVSFNIYPNPFSKKLTIQVADDNSFKIQSIKLYNSLGKLIINHQILDNKFILNKNDLPSGIYFLVITTNTNFVTTKKVMVK